jgi:hypothetical protein
MMRKGILSKDSGASISSLKSDNAYQTFGIDRKWEKIELYIMTDDKQEEIDILQQAFNTLQSDLKELKEYEQH